MPYLGWGGCGLETGVTFGFRASAVPGLGTAAPMTAEPLAKSRMQRLCPDGVLKMNRDGKSSFCHTAKSYFLPQRAVCWPALRDEKTLSLWGLQAAEIRAICPNSVRPSDFSHSYSSFTLFLTISTRLTSQYIAAVGSRSSHSIFSFIAFCYQNCWHTYLHPTIQIVQMQSIRKSKLGSLHSKPTFFQQARGTQTTAENSHWNFPGSMSFSAIWFQL